MGFREAMASKRCRRGSGFPNTSSFQTNEQTSVCKLRHFVSTQILSANNVPRNPWGSAKPWLPNTAEEVQVSQTHQASRPMNRLRSASCVISSPHKYCLLYTGCPRRNVQYFGRVFLMLNYTDITQNTYIQSSTVTEIMTREKWGHLAFPRSVRLQLYREPPIPVVIWLRVNRTLATFTAHKPRPTR